MLRAFHAVRERFTESFSKHDVLTLAAALAFYTALSLAPLLLLLITTLGFLGDDSQAQFMEQVQGLMGAQAADGIGMIIQNADDRPTLGSFAGIFGALVLLFSASSVFAQLQSSLNIIFESEMKPNEAGWLTFLKKRIFSMGMVLALAFLSLVSLATSTALAFWFSGQSQVWSVINNLISLVVFIGVFALIFHYLPDERPQWRHSFFGGIITALLFVVGKSLIGIYLGTSAVGSSYGAAGSLIVLLLWVYYSAAIVFVGAELTKAVFMAEGARSAKSSELRPKFAPSAALN